MPTGLPAQERFSHNPAGPHDLARAVQILDDQNQVQYVYSPDTVASELLTADLASTRWLDLLAFDAAQADKSFSLAPTRHCSPAEGIGDVTDLYRGEPQVARPPLVSSERAASGEVPPVQQQQSVETATEGNAWQLEEEVSLQDDELVLFRTFTERAALWMDLFDPLKHFATHATRLALRNTGLMKAILALTSRHAIANAQTNTVDANTPIQYYYETLHYVQESLQYTSYTRSEELLATVIIISTYEMLDDSSSNWKRHLRGVFWIQRSQDVHGASGGLRQAVWWTWLRQDLWAAFREKRTCFSFWKPLTDVADLTQDQLANRAIYLLSQTVNFYAHPSGNANADSPLSSSLAKQQTGDALLAALERWRTFLGPCYKPLPCAAVPGSPFKPIWIHPPQYAAALQAYNFGKILVTLHSPAVAGFQGYLKTQRVLSEAVDSICGIAMELKDEGSQILSAQCLFGAGLCTQDPAKRDAIISLIKKCEERTGWPMPTPISDLVAEWAKYS
ncbi:hypothetical protein N0V82_008125 [Gnomoniopsis sp. IMI 355080]|nr:hypothetical protein N0V82_008125 [Gnomoniopsis sp. IMI 355080]